MNIVESFISVFKNWSNFSGRACRGEYWYFYLSSFLLLLTLSFLDMALGLYDEEFALGLFSSIYQLIIIIPTIAVTSRRLQDFGISGWWQLSYFTIIGILVIFVLLIFPAREDENNWGRNPLLET